MIPTILVILWVSSGLLGEYIFFKYLQRRFDCSYYKVTWGEPLDYFRLFLAILGGPVVLLLSFAMHHGEYR